MLYKLNVLKTTLHVNYMTKQFIKRNLTKSLQEKSNSVKASLHKRKVLFREYSTFLVKVTPDYRGLGVNKLNKCNMMGFFYYKFDAFVFIRPISSHTFLKNQFLLSTIEEKRESK